MSDLLYNVIMWMLVSGGFAFFIVFIFDFIPFHKLVRGNYKKK